MFTGLIAYDTQRIKRIYIAGEEGKIAGKKAIMGALALYLDFLNLFLMLMRLFGSRRS
ncbi:inner membrane protein YbhL (plasmid) [Burkholderia cenocepacia]|nr:inner membrane protein YbhL [Burkholderia cenocepacia]